VVLKPLYILAERVPAWQEMARRIGFVSHREMVRAVEAEIRRLGILAA
jgi:hypothetical protein